MKNLIHCYREITRQLRGIALVSIALVSIALLPIALMPMALVLTHCN